MKRKYKMLRDRRFYLTPNYWVPKSYTSFEAENIYGIKIGPTYTLYSQGRMQSFHLQDDFDQVEKYVATRIFCSDEYFSNIASEIKRREKILKRFFVRIEKINFSQESFSALLAWCFEIMRKSTYYESANVIAWAYSADFLEKMIKNTFKIDQADFLLLTTPPKRTIVKEMEREVALLLPELAEGRIKIKDAAWRLSQKYGAIPHGFDGLEFWDQEYFQKELINKLAEHAGNFQEYKQQFINEDKILTDKKEEIVKRHGLTAFDLSLIEKINVIALWTDERKALLFKMDYYYNQIMLEVSRRYDISYKELKYLLTEELEEVPIDVSRAKKISQQRIGHEFAMVHKNGTFRFLSEAEKNKLKEELEQENKTTELKGTVASQGKQKKYQGRVKILLSPQESQKLAAGDWLVATMTTPDYISAMKRAVGFITDEGGVTCHAAIIAREMDKPCIIATGQATKILSDDDMIEVDMENGEIKKI